MWEKHRKMATSGGDTSRNSLDQALDKRWNAQNPDWDGTSARIAQEAEDFIADKAGPEEAKKIVTEVSTRVGRELLERAMKGEWDLAAHGGLIMYVCKRVHALIGDEMVANSWKCKEPDWESFKDKAHVLAAAREWRDKSKAEDDAQDALLVMWGHARKNDWNLSPLHYLTGTIKRLRVKRFHKDKIYGPWTVLGDKEPSGPMVGKFHEQLVEIMIGRNDKESAGLIETVRSQYGLLGSLVTKNPADEVGECGQDGCNPDVSSNAYATADPKTSNLLLLDCWNVERAKQGLPPKKIRDVENIVKRVTRRINQWIADTVLEQAGMRCQCTWKDCSCHSGGERCSRTLKSSYTVIDLDSRSVDPCRLGRTIAVCDDCAAAAKYWRDLQKSFASTRAAHAAQDTLAMWDSNVKGLRRVAEIYLRSGFRELQPCLESTRLDEANVFVRLRNRIVEQGEEAAIRDRARAMVGEVIEAFLSGKLGCREGTVLRRFLIQQIPLRLDEAKSAVNLRAQVAIHEVPEPKNQVEMEPRGMQVLCGYPAREVIQLHVRCDCLAVHTESDENIADKTAARKRSKGYIRVLVPADSLDPRAETIVCRCGEPRPFKIKGRCLSTNNAWAYEYINGNCEEDEIKPSPRQLRSQRFEKARVERALGRLRLSYDHWRVASAARVI